ncbi:hypothetical protein [Bradyrhizobium sp. UFLA05-112]
MEPKLGRTYHMFLCECGEKYFVSENEYGCLIAGRVPVAGMTTYPEKITFGEMRGSGTRDIIICCRDNRCGQRAEISADGFPSHVRLSEIEPKLTCTRCGKTRVEIRPKYSKLRMGAN